MKILSNKLFLGVFMFLLISEVNNDLFSQSLTSSNLATINVDDLSDSQVLNYLNQARESGYTQAQLEALAIQRGMSQSQISKLRRRIEQLSKGFNNGLVKDDLSIRNRRKQSELSEDDMLRLLANDRGLIELTKRQKKIFGFDLFKNDNLTFAPSLNIPTPMNYILGPGDEIIVDLWGATQQYWTYTISAEGTIRLENLSPLNVSGLTVKQAEEKIIDRLSQIYEGLKKDDGNVRSVFHQVSLGNVRTINVTLVGEVIKPGNYVLSSLSTVFTALQAAGGPNENGTFRKIKLIRRNKVKSEIDLYDFLVEGVKPNDERLMDDDVILVKLYDSRVEVIGEVRRPGIYETTSGENLSSVIKNAGNFGSQALRSFVTVIRTGEKGRTILNVDFEDFLTFKLKDGDQININTINEDFENRVQVEGAVYLPGSYELKDDLTVRGLIEKSNGLRGDAYLQRATIYRMNQNLSQSTIAFNLGDLLTKKTDDIRLQREDIVRISSLYDLKEEYYVEIKGEVSLAGVYPFFQNMTVEDLILLAGGVKNGASKRQIEISTRNIEGNNTLSEIIKIDISEDLTPDLIDSDYVLRPFDQVYIRTKPGYESQREITIVGEINSPGIYSIRKKDERVSDILLRAQGLTSYAYPEGALLIRKAEYASVESESSLNINKLRKLKARVLKDTSELINRARQDLIDRLEYLEKMEGDTNTDELGRRFRKEITQNIIQNDSVSNTIEIKENEPTVLYLDEVLKNPGSKYDYIVKDGDYISIPAKLETVRIAGEVISPLNVRFDELYKFKNYIADAGGFTQMAKRGRSYVQYPNGRKRQAKRFLFFKFYPKIEPGSTIYVERKADKTGISAQSWISIGTGLATLGLVTVQAIRLLDNTQ